MGDAWQELGLGALLTDCCLCFAQRWGVHRVWAETTTDNPRMITIFKQRGFTFDEPDDDEVLVN